MQGLFCRTDWSSGGRVEKTIPDEMPLSIASEPNQKKRMNIVKTRAASSSLAMATSSGFWKKYATKNKHDTTRVREAQRDRDDAVRCRRQCEE